MLKKLVYFFLILFLTLPLHTAQAQNVGFAKDARGDTYYFVTESIKAVNNNIFVSSVCEYGTERNGIAKKAFAIVFDSGERKYRLLGIASIGIDGKVLEKKEYPQAVWKELAGNPVEEALFSAVTRYLAHNPLASSSRGQNQPSRHKQATATGFFITPSIVVTSNHVVNAAKQIEVIYNNEMKAAATIICTDPASDLALLQVNGFENSVVPLELGQSGKVREGTRIYAVGFPLIAYTGTAAKITEGIISGTAGYKGDLKQFEISAPIQPGNSGGPLLNEKGEVIGVVAAELGRKFVDKTGIIPQSVNFAVKSDNIRSLLANQLGKFNLPISGQQRLVRDAVNIMDLAKKGIVRISVVVE